MNSTSLTRLTFLGTAVAATALQSKGEQAAAAGPNLILCMADELRTEGIACYGHPVVKTPNIDRLASEGTFRAVSRHETARPARVSARGMRPRTMTARIMIVLLMLSVMETADAQRKSAST